MKNKLTINQLVKIAMAAAIYIVLTLVLAPISYGPIQFRVSEILNLLAFIDPLYIISLTIGCAISNLYSFGIIDVFVGSAGTLIATFLIYKSKNIWVASIWPSVFVSFVAVELYVLQNLPLIPTYAGLAASEFIIVTIIGVPVFKILMKNNHFMKIIKIK